LCSIAAWIVASIPATIVVSVVVSMTDMTGDISASGISYIPA
jgi:hypothetical protein